MQCFGTQISRSRGFLVSARHKHTHQVQGWRQWLRRFPSVSARSGSRSLLCNRRSRSQNSRCESKSPPSAGPIQCSSGKTVCTNQEFASSERRCDQYDIESLSLNDLPVFQVISFTWDVEWCRDRALHSGCPGFNCRWVHRIGKWDLSQIL